MQHSFQHFGSRCIHPGLEVKDPKSKRSIPDSPVQGLRTYSGGWCCLGCQSSGEEEPFCALSEETVKNHWSLKHSGVACKKGQPKSEQCTVQTFCCSYGFEHFFIVKPPTSSHECASLQTSGAAPDLAAIISQEKRLLLPDEQQASQSMPIDDRLYHPLLKSSGIMAFTSPFIQEEVVSFTQYEDMKTASPTFKKLAKAVRSSHFNTCHKIESTHSSIR